MFNSWLEFQKTEAEIGSMFCNVTWAKGLGKMLAAISSHSTNILGCLSLLLLEDMTLVYWENWNHFRETCDGFGVLKPTKMKLLLELVVVYHL